jgi:hypothetical protein
LLGLRQILGKYIFEKQFKEENIYLKNNLKKKIYI